MGKKSEALSGEEVGQDDHVQSFIADLHSAPSDGHVLHGMVKPANTTDGLMFAHVGGCDHWIFIPEGAIETVRRTGRVGCKGHFHPSAEIELKVPQSDLEVALSNAANLHLAGFAQLRASLTVSGADDHGCRPGTSWKCSEYGCGCFP